MSGEYAVFYSPKALDDLREIYAYIAFSLKAPGSAKGLVDRLRREIRSLSEMPLRFALVEWEPWKSMGMRRLPVRNFVVFYLAKEEKHEVTVIRIVYGGRDFDSVLTE